MVFDYRPHSHSWAVGRVMRAASLLNFFSLPRLPWSSGSDDDDKVNLSVLHYTCMPACIYSFVLIVANYFMSLFEMVVLIVQIVLTKTEVESLRSEITDAEEREAYLKAQ